MHASSPSHEGGPTSTPHMRVKKHVTETCILFPLEGYLFKKKKKKTFLFLLFIYLFLFFIYQKLIDLKIIKIFVQTDLESSKFLYIFFFYINFKNLTVKFHYPYILNMYTFNHIKYYLLFDQ